MTNQPDNPSHPGLPVIDSTTPAGRQVIAQQMLGVLAGEGLDPSPEILAYTQDYIVGRLYPHEIVAMLDAKYGVMRCPMLR